MSHNYIEICVSWKEREGGTSSCNIIVFTHITKSNKLTSGNERKSIMYHYMNEINEFSVKLKSVERPTLCVTDHKYKNRKKK